MRGSTLLASTRKLEIDSVILTVSKTYLFLTTMYVVLVSRLLNIYFSSSICSFQEQYAFEHFRDFFFIFRFVFWFFTD